MSEENSHKDDLAAWAKGYLSGSNRMFRRTMAETDLIAFQTSAAENLICYRGLFEAIGTLRFERNAEGYPVPAVLMHASPIVLWLILDYCYRNCPRFDRTSSIIGHIGKGKAIFKGSRAITFVEFLYPPTLHFQRVTEVHVGLGNFIQIVLNMRSWLPRSGTPADDKRQDLAVDRKLMTGLIRVGERVPYEHLRPW